MASRYDTVSSPFVAVFKREWKLLLRTPLYIINGLTGAIIGPILVIIMFFAQGSEKAELLKYISNPDYSVYFLLGGLGLMLFTAGMNTVASTSVSREGRCFWVTKMIPVQPRQQVLGKFLQSYMVSVLGVLSTAVIFGIFLKFSLLQIISMVIVGLIGSVSMTALNLLIDVLHPKLVWNSEQEAMKQNINSLLGMLASIAVICLLGACAVIILTLGMPAWAAVLGIGAVSTVLAVPSVVVLLLAADKMYARLEA
jgi:ABC-2 type transport system permease protein